MLATITGVYNDGVSIRVDGESAASYKHYRVNRAATYEVGDRVYVDKVGSTYIIAYPIGRIGTGGGGGGGSGSEIVIVNTTAQLGAGGWTLSSGIYTQTIPSGMGSDFSAIIGPADRSSAEEWAAASVFCTQSGANFVFTAASLPTVDIGVNIVILEVEA